ncbi:MAG: hypothetical protein AABY77_03515, partial [Nitrospirota bacterium]
MIDPRRIVIVVLLALGLSGCVTKENYNAQILRTNNFQRLLSEEEKRTVELSTEIARLKDQGAILEAKHKALTAQFNDSKAQVVRSLEEVGRLQDEVKQARGGFSSVPALRGPSQEPPDRLGELQEKPAAPSEKKGDKKKGKAEAKVKVQKQSDAPPQSPQPKVELPVSVPPAPPEPLLRAPSQEPPDRLGELQEKPAAKPVAKPDKKVEPKKGKATVKIKVQKQGEEPPPSSPPKAEAPAPPSPPPAKAEAKVKVQAKTETEAAP